MHGAAKFGGLGERRLGYRSWCSQYRLRRYFREFQFRVFDSTNGIQS